MKQQQPVNIVGLLILLGLSLGLFFTLYFSFEEKEEKVVKITPHNYDYIIEVSDGDSDSTLTYTIYDQNHELVGDSLTSKDLDSVIILDNL